MMTKDSKTTVKDVRFLGLSVCAHRLDITRSFPADVCPVLRYEAAVVLVRGYDLPE
jgi:hypothetical protein